MWLETVHKSEGDTEKCPTCGGSVQRRAYGEMYAGASIQDGVRVEIRKRPKGGFIGPVVLDPITQYFNGGLYRVWPSDKYYSRGGKKLHRDVWEDAFGPIPAKSHIHHIDKNPANNELSNLECLPAAEHTRIPKLNVHGFSELARERAADWHKSEEGRLWHSRHAVRGKSWTKWKREDKPCEFCKKVFQALVRESGNTQKYCCEKCKVAAYRARGADKDATARYRARKKLAGKK